MERRIAELEQDNAFLKTFGFADLKSWRVLTKLRTDATQATTLLRACSS
ncbi:hypothetical protein AB0C27_09770 [Nonomuraea sp. NPDC048882]